MKTQETASPRQSSMSRRAYASRQDLNVAYGRSGKDKIWGMNGDDIPP
jgi:hypothetical protein